MLKKLYAHLFCKPHMERRIPVLLLSVILMGACVAVFDQVHMGTDPCTVFNLGMAENVLHWNGLGTWQLLFNVLLLAVILLMKEGRVIGLGSLANMVLVGYSKDFFDWVLTSLHPLNDAGLTERILFFLPAMAIFLVAVAFYMVVELGVAPYDAVPQIIARRLPKVPFAAVRIAFDLVVTVAGFLIGSEVGVMTVLCVFFLGPIIQMIANRFRPFFQ